MFDLDSFNELSIINDSGKITAKIKEVICFAREQGFICDTDKFINIIIDKDMVTAKAYLSFSCPSSADDAIFTPSFTIGEIIYIKNAIPLIDKIEGLLAFIRGKGYFAEISPSNLRIANHALAIKLLLKFSFQQVSLEPLAGTLFSDYQLPYKPNAEQKTANKA